MKLSSVNNTYSERPRTQQHNSNNKTSNVNFTGTEVILDAMVKFWQTIDNGGRALQFTCEDMFGTNFPRSYKGLTAGKKYTGKYNWAAFFQEAIREFLTGPTMTFFPMAALAFSKAKFGPSANTKNENINNLSYLMEKVQSGDKESVKNSFFDIVSKDMLEQTLNGANDNRKHIKDESKQLSKALRDYSSAFDSAILAKGQAKKQAKNNLKKQEDALSDLFTSIIKKNKADFSDTNFQTVKYTLGNSTKESGTTGFKDYSEYIASYIHDYIKRNTTNNIVNTSKETIQSFKNNWGGKRLFTMFNMIVLTGLLMREIPKLYTKASGKVNPNASSIYNEAKNRKQGAKTTENKEVNNAK